MSETCPECGAPVPEGGTCKDNFHALLALEWQVPDGAGAIAHFFAVSAYGLQHPESMHYTAEALAWLRSAVTEAIETGCSVEELRASAQAQSHESGAHVTRHGDDPVPAWGRSSWTTTVADVIAGGVDDYGGRVKAWASATLSDIDQVSRHA